MNGKDKRALQEKVIRSCLRTGIQSEEDLHRFVEYSSGLRVPFERVCPHHGTPWDYIRLVFFNITDSLIVIAPRGGSKTQTTAILNFLELALIQDVEIASVGAIKKQAKKCFDYTKDIFRRQGCTEALIDRATQTEMESVLGGFYEQLIGTLTGSNSPHPHRLRVDEVELIRPEILEELYLVPATKTDPVTNETIIPSNISMVSSMKWHGGNMQTLEKNHKDMGFELLKWCYKEVAAACPVERRGTQKVITQVTNEITNEDHAAEVYEGCPACPLLNTCRGDLARSSGYMPVQELIRKRQRLALETWIAQLEGFALPSPLLVYKVDPRPDGANVRTDLPFDPDLPTVVGIDPGGSAPTAVLWFQFVETNDGSLAEVRIIEEIYRAEMPTGWFAQQIAQVNQRLGCVPEYYLVDMAAKQWRVDLANAGMGPIKTFKKGRIAEGIERVRAFVRDATGRTHISIAGRCQHTITEALNYRYPHEHAALPTDKGNHAMDVLRYMITQRYGFADEFIGTGGVQVAPATHPVTHPDAYRGNPNRSTKSYLR